MKDLLNQLTKAEVEWEEQILGTCLALVLLHLVYESKEQSLCALLVGKARRYLSRLFDATGKYPIQKLDPDEDWYDVFLRQSKTRFEKV